MNDAAVIFVQDGIRCQVHTFGAPVPARTPLFVMPFFGDASDSMEGQHMRLDPAIAAGNAAPFMLAVFETHDWNNALSPWPSSLQSPLSSVAAPRRTPCARSLAPPHPSKLKSFEGNGRGETDFGGGASATLGWIVDNLMPAVEARVPQARGGARGLLGYSMAGMFALWAAYQTDAFAVYGSCSGSLWYDGFIDYLEQNAPKAPCSVYLSLGDKEEKARNPLFARVGGATRRAATLMAASPMVRDTTLAWHPGGHTGSVGERLAAALLWMAQHL